jgi:hypothetical protein
LTVRDDGVGDRGRPTRTAVTDRFPRGSRKEQKGAPRKVSAAVPQQLLFGISADTPTFRAASLAVALAALAASAIPALRATRAQPTDVLRVE